MMSIEASLIIARQNEWRDKGGAEEWRERVRR